MCYTLYFSAEERVRYEKCVYTYEDLIPRKEPEDSDGIRYLRKYISFFEAVTNIMVPV